MDLLLLLKAIFLGMVEGLTEFLPISSTGHLIVVSSLLNFAPEKQKTFEIVIQLGALLALCFEYRQRLMQLTSRFFARENTAMHLVRNILIAFFPAAILGILFSSSIKKLLFAPIPVALALIVGGLLIALAELRNQKNSHPCRVSTMEQVTWRDALKVGLAQSLALIPGVSRSGATIISGMWFGFSRPAATEFSFFLAIPTLLGATLYALHKEHSVWALADLPVFITGIVAAFISALICVRWLLRYISHHNFMVFAWYRIIFGLLILITNFTSLIHWN